MGINAGENNWGGMTIKGSEEENHLEGQMI
jgi:hypothetical protein